MMPYPISIDGNCSVGGCERPLKQCGYCAMHYKRVLYNGDPGPVGELPRKGVAPPQKVCDAEGCDNLTRSHKEAHCSLHRARAARGADMTAPRLKTPNAGVCAVEGCSRQAVTKQMCKGHYGRFLRLGDPGPAEFIEAKFAPFVRNDGYVTAYANGRWDLQHRLVMEDVLGRRLLPGETPHHRNGDRADNRPANLELWSKAQPAGQRVEDKIAWCAEIIRQYPEMASNYGLAIIENKSPYREELDEYLHDIVDEVR